MRQIGRLRFGTLVALLVSLFQPGTALARTLRIVAFGDSLSAGFELPANGSFPAQLEAALRAKGRDVTVVNAGVSGDTASDGLARLDWSVPAGADLVIVEFGANDMLRGLDPAITRRALDEILTRLQARGASVLLAGMRSMTNLGESYRARFETIYPELAKAHGVPLYPFFLEGIAEQAAFNLADGMHPNRSGVGKIVAGILPSVEAALDQIGGAKASSGAVGNR
ncbi:MAG: acyl-CoA thioesterase [Methylobacteriaceae bacterium]|nr:acyl-CoA thioesterase [Methylobacteriaceae bacterium]